MSYFHTGTRTIIGAEAFHCPVRDGKEWDHLAMVIRLNWLPTCASFDETCKTANSKSRLSVEVQMGSIISFDCVPNSIEDRHNRYFQLTAPT